MDYVKIAGKVYDCLVISIEQDFTIIYSENTGRSLDGAMFLDPIGTFIGHVVTFAARGDNVKEFDDLFNFLKIPRNSGVMVNVVNDQSTMQYEAYVSNGKRKVSIIDGNSGKVRWESLQVHFIPVSPQVKP